MCRSILVCCILALACFARHGDSDDTSKPYGLAARTPWTSSQVTGTPDPPPPYRTQRVFPHIHFKNPVVVTMAPGLDRWFVGEQAGKIYSFLNRGDATQQD